MPKSFRIEPLQREKKFADWRRIFDRTASGTSDAPRSFCTCSGKVELYIISKIWPMAYESRAPDNTGIT
jgi:hypothetical protein